jgi:enediyne biosynthesis protein E4
VPGLAQSSGWWNRIVAGDFTGDGKVDFVVGNLGLNSRLVGSPTAPATMFVKDFDGNGFADQIVACYSHGKSYPLVLRDELIKALPPLKVRFLSYTEYAKAGVSDIFPASDLANAVVKKAELFASVLMQNNGNGSFTLVPLPDAAQVAPVYGISASDIDGDGVTDLLLAGNFDGVKPDIARLHASYGVLLRGTRGGGLSAVARRASGFFVPGQTRELLRLRSRTGELTVAARNNDRPLVFRTTGRVP